MRIATVLMALLRVLGRLPQEAGATSSGGPAVKNAVAADPGIVPYLVSLLGEKDVQSFTLGVVSTLGQIEDARALPVLKRLRKDSKDDRIRIYCEEAILRIQGCSLAQKAAA